LWLALGAAACQSSPALVTQDADQSSDDAGTNDDADTTPDASAAVDALPETDATTQQPDATTAIDAAPDASVGHDAQARDATSTDASTTKMGRSTGCGMNASMTGLFSQTMDVNGTTHTYWMWIDPHYDPNTPVPLYMGWHGSGGSGLMFRPGFGGQWEGTIPGIFVYPDGLPQSNGNGPGWELPPNTRDTAFYEQLYAHLTDNYCVDLSRVFNYGFSIGGFFVHSLGCLYGDKVRAIAVIAGGLVQSPCVGSVAAWMHQNDDDPYVMLSWAEGARNYWIRTNHCNASSTTPSYPAVPCVSYQGCDQEVTWCEHATGGHSWIGPTVVPAIEHFFLQF
jgi:poly(3-hydroxybutyrate) depolymerase